MKNQIFQTLFYEIFVSSCGKSKNERKLEKMYLKNNNVIALYKHF